MHHCAAAQLSFTVNLLMMTQKRPMKFQYDGRSFNKNITNSALLIIRQTSRLSNGIHAQWWRLIKTLLTWKALAINRQAAARIMSAAAAILRPCMPRTAGFYPWPSAKPWLNEEEFALAVEFPPTLKDCCSWRSRLSPTTRSIKAFVYVAIRNWCRLTTSSQFGRPRNWQLWTEKQ